MPLKNFDGVINFDIINNVICVFIKYLTS